MTDELVVVGRVGRPHGLDGSFVVEDASADPERFVQGASVWILGEPARIVASKRARGRPVIRLDRPIERGQELCVQRADLPAPAEDSYYAFELIGLLVEEEDGGALGRVQEVAPGVANDVLELDTGLTLPMHETCVREVDLEARRILVARGFADAG